VQDSGHIPADRASLLGIANHPVVYVTWHDALAYTRWLDEKLRRLAQEKLAAGVQEAFWRGLAEKRLHASLPSEAEWEKAARGADGRIYPWGNEFDLERVNAEMNIGTTSAAGSFPGGASPYGALDLSGNVWEWTRSLWGKDYQKPEFGYPYDSSDGREDLDVKTGNPRVLRGGAFYGSLRSVRCAYRYRHYPDYRDDHIGFRVVVSPFDPGF
jgi:formylglycine-generating enzyme required for sulfatase activity